MGLVNLGAMRLVKFKKNLLLGSAIGVFLGWSAQAFDAYPAAEKAGQFDLSLRGGLARGDVSPHSNAASLQQAEINYATFGAGYGIGDVGPFKDLYLRFEATTFKSELEKVGANQFYGADNGALSKLVVAFNLIHELDYSFGFFIAGTLPHGIEFDKFSNFQFDQLAGGTHLFVELTNHFVFDSSLYVGSGVHRRGGNQNGRFGLDSMATLRMSEWLLPHAAGVRFGPYFEGDLTDRVDLRYNSVFSASGERDSIRSFQFGFKIQPYFKVMTNLAVELGYVQSLGGYYLPYSKVFTLGLHMTL